MRTRSDIKAQAKRALASQHGNAILIYFVGMMVLGAAGAILPGVGALLVLPVVAGLSFSFLNIYRARRADVGDLFAPFKDYGRTLGGLLWMELWIFLWSCLFVIPGIVKAIAYSLTPYILADSPASATDALKLSMRMTEGYKGEIFVFFLSYIGWMILSGLTFGILEIVYVGPYRSIALSGLYEELKANALRNGTVTASELGMIG
ncbi:MAG: DUF975 family protein [Christensenellales bacterium]|jgi:uncharacterized membrane protein